LRRIKMPHFSLIIEAFTEWEVEADNLAEAKRKAREEFLTLANARDVYADKLIDVRVDVCLDCDRHHNCATCENHSEFHTMCMNCGIVDVDRDDNIDPQGRIICPKCFYEVIS
jgi:hypothetical protein